MNEWLQKCLEHHLAQARLGDARSAYLAGKLLLFQAKVLGL